MEINQQAITPRMQSKLADLNLLDSYHSGEHDLVSGFYRPCLQKADAYDRAVGYFRSSVFLIGRQEVVDFARRGGQMRVVCSPELTSEDIEAISGGYRSRGDVIAEALIRDLNKLLDDPVSHGCTEVLATLIRVGVLQVRVAFLREGHGIFHEKMGIFSDMSGQAVSFRGSANESFRAWYRWGNVESFEVFRSWKERDAKRVEGHQETFEKLWQGNMRRVKTIDFPDVALQVLNLVAKPTLYDIADRKSKTPQKGPNIMTPFPHQTEAISAWEAAGRRGILEHATGSGKTFTALLALRDHLATGHPALVLVPSELLLRQWADEIASILPDCAVLLAGAGHSDWRASARVRAMTSNDPESGARIVLATMQTAAKLEFRRKIESGDHLFLVADEVHRTGSPTLSQLFGINAGPRLGLSATPVRYGDPVGTQQIMQYFGGVIRPPFTLRDALTSDPPRLVPYDYVPHRLSLTAEEADSYSAFSAQVRREYARCASGLAEGESVAITGRLKLLLIQRARIVKKASRKERLAEDVLRTFRNGEFWLVYCEDQDQMARVHDRLIACGLPSMKYFAEMNGDKDGTLGWFREHGGILVAIRCLDEGVDIPQTSHALILASSQNPREFIQRRGRVLRKAPTSYGKTHAVIHDALVMPPDMGTEHQETAIAVSELARAVEFADTARNRVVCMASLLEIVVDCGLDMNKYLDVGLEIGDNGELHD